MSAAFAAPVQNRFRRQQRIRRPREFESVRSHGVQQRGPGFIVRAAWQPGAGESVNPAPARLGLIASRRVGNAVVRNRCKRLIREVFRQEQARWPDGLDLVVIAQSDMSEVSFGELRPRLISACERAIERLRGKESRSAHPAN